MQSISVFDMFKIGVGPSSSHTMGPWLAALDFIKLAESQQQRIDSLHVDLFGSLAKTGKGHGTDVAVQLGLSGYDPKTVDVDRLDEILATIKSEKRLLLAGQYSVVFDPARDIAFHFDRTLDFHPNGMCIRALSKAVEIRNETYFSVGGGFIVREGAEGSLSSECELPRPISTAQDLIDHCERDQDTIANVVMKNELAWRDRSDVEQELDELRDTMFSSVHRGCSTQGTLPGGLGVHRRAYDMASKLLGTSCPPTVEQLRQTLRDGKGDFQHILDWVSCFALAVNEENASFGRIVTAPTNGAAGVIPAVLLYCLSFCEVEADAHREFLLVAGEIGSIFKKGATISAAMGGCQAEIGVSSAMAAAALCSCLGGSPQQACEAAEIAMEHHLGLTCDPIGGLVQVPCIERNAMGAIKAITAAQLALQRDVTRAKVCLDGVIRTMWETAQNMNSKYKETSEGGLATQISVNVPEC